MTNLEKEIEKNKEAQIADLKSTNNLLELLIAGENLSLTGQEMIVAHIWANEATIARIKTELRCDELRAKIFEICSPKNYSHV